MMLACEQTKSGRLKQPDCARAAAARCCTRCVASQHPCPPPPLPCPPRAVSLLAAAGRHHYRTRRPEGPHARGAGARTSARSLTARWLLRSCAAHACPPPCARMNAAIRRLRAAHGAGVCADQECGIQAVRLRARGRRSVLRPCPDPMAPLPVPQRPCPQHTGSSLAVVRARSGGTRSRDGSCAGGAQDHLTTISSETRSPRPPRSAFAPAVPSRRRRTDWRQTCS